MNGLRNSVMPSPRFFQLIVPGVLLSIAASCTGNASPEASIRPLGFGRITFDELPASVDEAEILVSLGYDDPTFPWKGVARGGVELGEVPAPSPGSAPLEGMALTGRKETKAIEGPIPPASAGFNEIVVEAAASDGPHERVQLILQRNGQTVYRSPSASLRADGALDLLAFPVPGQRTRTTRADRFRVEFAGNCDVDLVHRVSFVRQPLSRFLVKNEPFGSTRLVGDLLRRSVSVTSADPRTAAVVLREGETMNLHLAGDPDFQPRGEAYLFEVTVTGSGSPARRSVSVERGEWASVSFRASEVGAGPARLRVSVGPEEGEGSAVGFIGEASIRRQGEAGPTVVLITSDTHRADHVGVFNSASPVATPHLNALAARGVAFGDCLSSTNITKPAHMALMTGLHPLDIGILSNRSRLAATADTLAERFAAAGYQTFAVTSAFLLLDQHSGLGQGFDRMEGPLRLQRDGEVSISRLVDWIDGADGAPVFAWLHLFDAHEPYGPPEPYDRKYYEGDEPFGERAPGLDKRLIPHWLEGLQDLDYPYAQYRAEVDYLDGALAQLLDHPRVRNGAVAFTADHGESFGEHGIWWGHAGLYPGTTQVPLIMSWPGSPQGLLVDAPVQHRDVAHTLLTLSDVGADSFPGRDLRQAIADEPVEEPRFMIGGHGFSAAVRSGDWLFTMDLRRHHEATREQARSTGQSELFNLSMDPRCEEDLLLEEIDRAVAMRKALLNWIQSAPPEGLREDQRRSPEDESMLAALGYADHSATRSSRVWDPERRDGPSTWEESPWRRFFEDEAFRERFLAARKNRKN